MSKLHVLVIIGSVRPQRIGPEVARWIADLGRSEIPADFELIDLRLWDLPMDGEPGIPAQGNYTQTGTLSWSRKVANASGVVFVTPQYNWGYPAPLKNAIDHLYAEWREKPALIATYGGHGGGKCARQLREVLSGLKMQIVDIMPELTLPAGQVQANSGSIDPGTAFASEQPIVLAALQKFRELLIPVQP